MSNKQMSKSDKACCFCGRAEENDIDFGKIYEHDNIVTHYYCLLLSSNMQQKGQDDEGILGFLTHDIREEIRRGKRLVCSYCKKSGATLGCCNVRCKKIFHFPCGLGAGTLNQFFGEFRSYCVNHRPNQKIDTRIKNELSNCNDIVCYICYDKVNPCDVINTVRAPCCKKNTWFHKQCVKQLALSAGYFFKCPLCNDKKTFQNAMLQCGIFIPSQDASWELVPNAFEELLYRHDQCDAPICLCPRGRKYRGFNAKWELALCQTCGSQGIHMACGDLKWANPAWKCNECNCILDKPEAGNSCNSEDTSTNTILQNLNPTACVLRNKSDPEDSDSDISVGKYSPVPFAPDMSSCSTSEISFIKSRPGPRTFKLRQLKAHRDMKNLSLNNNKKEEKVDSTVDVTNNKKNSELHSQIQAKLTALADVIKTDKNNDISNKCSENITYTAANVNTNTNAVSSSVNDNIEVQESNNIQNSSSFSLRETCDTNRNSNEANFLPSLPNTEICDKFDDIIELYRGPAFDCADGISNIQIMNIVSIAPEEFENMTHTKGKEKTKNIEDHSSQSKHKLCASTPVSSSCTPQFDISGNDLKRKIDNCSFDLAISPRERSKKLKKGSSVYRQRQQTLLKDIESDNDSTTVNNVSSGMFNEDSITIHSNKHNISANAISLQNENLVLKQANRNHSIETSLFNESLNAKIGEEKFASLIDLEGKDDRSMYAHNLSDKITKETWTENCAKNYDRNAGISSADESRKSDCTSDSRVNSTKQFDKARHSDSEYNRLDTLSTGKKREQRDVEITTVSKQKESNASPQNIYNYNRLSQSDCILLQDLKFRVHNSSTLQMILYNEFAVNINMECANVIKNTKPDVSIEKTVQQEPSKIQLKISSNTESDDNLYSTSISNRDKCKHSTLQNNVSENYRDDLKENLNPLTTISCRNTSKSFFTNPTFLENNIIASTSNNQSDEENLIQFPHSASIVSEGNNIIFNRDIKNIESTPDVKEYPNVTTGVSADKHCKSINNEKENVQILRSNHVTSSVDERYSTKIVTNSHYHDTRKIVQRTLLLGDHANCRPENNARTSAGNAHLKISIDLEKIENIFDGNPNIFINCKEKNYKQRLEKVSLLKTDKVVERMDFSGRRIMRSLIDESKHFQNFRVLFPGETKKGANRNDEMVVKNL